MVDLGVALTWIVISAASAKGLAAFARAAATNGVEAASSAGEGTLADDGLYAFDALPHLPSRFR